MAKKKITNTKTELLKEICADKNCTEKQIETILEHKDCFTETHKEICADKNCNDFECAKKHNMLEKIIHRHIHHIHKHGCRLLHHAHHLHHKLGHFGELLLIGGIFAVNFINAGFTPSANTLITDHTIIAVNLVNAEKQGRPGTNDSKIISMRTLNSDVENSFAPGYCTYGAALISPEFFPFINDKKQQRTWGGNAKDRCANAQATGYSIGSTPMQGALVVYSKIGNSTLFGHVGKVMHYNASKGTLIVRDMNRVSKFTMTDRRETKDNPNISCYIYNKKPTPVLAVNEPTPPPATTTQIGGPSTGGLSTGILIATNTNNSEIIKAVISENKPAATTPTTSPTHNTPQPATTTNIPIAPIEEQYTTKNINLNFDSVSDLAKHFLTQRNIEAKLTTKNTLQIGETATLTLTIKDIATQAGFEGLLDLPFELVTSNDNIQTSYSLIQFIKEGRMDITITAKNKGDTTLLINFDGEKIGKVNFVIPQ